VRIALVSDAWRPQVNGVVRTLTALTRELSRAGHDVTTITPDLFPTVPCPFYPEIRLAIGARKRMTQRLDVVAPDAIHIVTEGPLGLAARGYCVRRAIPFTTAYCTRFPEYIAARFGFPEAWSYRLLRRFHGAASGVMVATASIRGELAARGFKNLRSWTRGVDTAHFHPAEKSYFQLPRPVFLTVGRVALEKNLLAFLDLDLPGSKIVVGDGPQLAALRQRYPTVHFPGFRDEADLVRYYAAADVFVFPSRTDTFGLVMLEALASGVPVAAFPVPGPLDVIGDSGVGCLDDDLKHAALRALEISSSACRNYALNFHLDALRRAVRGESLPDRSRRAAPQPGRLNIKHYCNRGLTKQCNTGSDAIEGEVKKWSLFLKSSIAPFRRFSKMWRCAKASRCGWQLPRRRSTRPKPCVIACSTRRWARVRRPARRSSGVTAMPSTAAAIIS